MTQRGRRWLHLVLPVRQSPHKFHVIFYLGEGHPCSGTASGDTFPSLFVRSPLFDRRRPRAYEWAPAVKQCDRSRPVLISWAGHVSPAARDDRVCPKCVAGGGGEMWHQPEPYRLGRSELYAPPLNSQVQVYFQFVQRGIYTGNTMQTQYWKYQGVLEGMRRF